MRMIHPLLFFGAAFLFSAQVSATAQRPDLITLDGKLESLQTNPLASYLEENQDSLPTNQKPCAPSRASDVKNIQAAENNSDSNDEVAVEIGPICVSAGASNNWRGYVAT